MSSVYEERVRGCRVGTVGGWRALRAIAQTLALILLETGRRRGLCNRGIT